MIIYAYTGEGQEGPKCDYVIFECSLMIKILAVF